MSVYLEVGVSYTSDLEHVEEVTVEVAKQVMDETEGAVEGYEPSIWYTEFGDSNINFWVVLRAHGYGESWLLKHKFIKALFRRYNEEGIEISFPARNIYMRDGTAEPDAAQIEAAARSRARRAEAGSSDRRPTGVDLGAAEQGAGGDPTGGDASPGGGIPPG
jgi:small-conductance mechanosensitive channel